MVFICTRKYHSVVQGCTNIHYNKMAVIAEKGFNVQSTVLYQPSFCNKRANYDYNERQPCMTYISNSL